MSDTEQTSTPTPNDVAPQGEVEQQSEAEQQEQPAAFSQEDVDRIVADRLKRERDKFKDYDDLKAKAGEARTAEERLAELEGRYAEAETRALRANIASEYGIAAGDRDLFLTGSDEETLTAQAKRLAERESERKTHGNTAPLEGATPKQPLNDERRDFVRGLVAGAQ